MFGFGGGEPASSGGGKDRMERIGEYAVYATPMKEGGHGPTLFGDGEADRTV